MKTKIVSLLGIALLALASCQGGGTSSPSSAPSSTLPSEGSSPVLSSTPEESSTPTSTGDSSSSPTSSSSSSEPSSETPVTIDEEYVADLLNSYITGENFQVDYQGYGADGESIVDFHDYYTQDYIYISYADTYVIELPDYRDETKSLVYNLYPNEEDGFDLGIVLLYGNGTPVTEVTDSYNHLYQTPLLSKKDFVETEETGTFKTENGDLINNIASLFGENYSMTASLGIFTHILFTPLENGDLAFDLYGYDTYGTEILNTTTLYLSAKLTHLGTTVYQPLADYLDFYRNTDKVTLQPNQVEELTGDVLTLLNTKKVCKAGETDGELYMTREITTSQDLYRIINTYAGGAPFENIYAKDEETGYTNSYNFYLDASNSPSFSGPVDMPFDSTFGMIQNVFKGDLSPFVSLDGGKHFNYIGVDPYGLNTTLTDEYSYPTRFELFVENDKLDKITLTYPAHTQDEEGNILHYVTDITFLDPKPITLLEPLPEDEDTPTIKEAFDKLKTGTYKVSAIDVQDHHNQDLLETYVTEDTILSSVHTKNDNKTTYSGYRLVDNQVIAFTVGTDMVAKKTDVVKGTLQDYIPFQASPNVFSIDEDGSFFLKEGIHKASSFLFTGPDAYGLIESTLRIEVDDQNRVDTITYDYDMFGSAGQDRVTISDYGTVTLPVTIDFSSLD